VKAIFKYYYIKRRQQMSEYGEVGKKMPQVPEAMVDMQNASGLLDDSLNRLTDRLSMVLMPNMPTPACEGINKSVEPIKVPLKVPLAGEIWGMTQKIRSFNLRVESLLSRLEV
jgi:hypothetical protein